MGYKAKERKEEIIMFVWFSIGLIITLPLCIATALLISGYVLCSNGNIAVGILPVFVGLLILFFWILFAMTNNERN